MIVQRTIERKLAEALTPDHLEVVNESSNHSVPPGSETHFKVVIVSSVFEGRPLVERHRMVTRLLAEQLNTVVHALALHTFTPSQWAERGGAADSPACRGGMGK